MTCTGQFQAGFLCGNPTASTTLPKAASPTALGVLPLTGGTLTGKLVTVAPGSGAAGFNLLPGVAPAAPVNGDIWTTNLGLFVQIGGATISSLVAIPAVITPVAIATTSNITLSGEQTIDGVLTSSTRILVKNQTTGSQNGVYITGSGAWTRTPDWGTTSSIIQGIQVYVNTGTTQTRTNWVVSTSGAITVGTTSVAFVKAVSFIATGSGATIRTAQAKDADIVSIKDYGGAGDNATDNAAALVAAITALPTRGGAIYFPAGKYLFASNVATTLPNSIYSVTLYGDGQDATILYWPNAAGGLKFTWANLQNAVHVYDLAITTAQATGGTGLELLNTTVYGGFVEDTIKNIERVTFQGDTGTSAGTYWTKAISVTGLNYVSFDKVLIYGGVVATVPQGTGAYLTDSAGVVTADFKFANCTFNDLDTGLLADGNPQGVIVSTTTFVGSVYGIRKIGATALESMQVTNCNFACTTANILVSTMVNDLVLNGNVLITDTTSVASGKSISLLSVAGFVANNNMFLSASSISTTAISVVDSTGWPGSICGNTFRGPFGVGIALGASTSLIKAYPNSFGSSVVTPTTDAGINNNTIVPATDGGTGNKLYVAGDLLYADTTTTLARLADIAAGNALLSGGGGGYPFYGKIGLTTHVSGVLPGVNGGSNRIQGGKLLSANFNSTADQAITITSPTANYRISEININNCSTSITTAVGGFYTTTSKGGFAFVAAGQSYSTATGAAVNANGSGLQVGFVNQGNVFNLATIYFSLTTPQGGAATGDIYVTISPLY